MTNHTPHAAQDKSPHEERSSARVDVTLRHSKHSVRHGPLLGKSTHR